MISVDLVPVLILVLIKKLLDLTDWTISLNTTKIQLTCKFCKK